MIIELSTVGVVIVGFTSIATIGTVFLKSRKYIEDRIQEALSKDEIIEKISLLVKPDMIFDGKGAIVADRGASAFIHDNGIHIISEDGSIPDEIRISFSKHIKIPPLLTSLNPDIVSVTSKRGKHHEWIYGFEYTALTDFDDNEYSRVYRLEIL